MYKIPLAKPDITDLDRRAVLEVLKTPNLSLGPKLKEFEEKIAQFIGVKYAVGVNSGTSALHLIIRALGIKDGDEVITTPFTFIASSNCVLYERAKPIFVDIDEKTLNIDPDKIKKTITNLPAGRQEKLKAILAVDIFGHSADWDKILKIAKKYKLKVIEDSAEAIGSEYKGKKCGSFGDTAILAFYANKQITTGEGGMVLTNNKKIAGLYQSMANQGREIKNGKWLEHIRLGYNYRLDEMSCALGVAQLRRINEILKKREKVAKMYNERLKEFPDVELPYIAPDVKISWFVYVIKLSHKYSQRDRDRIIKEMERVGIQCGNYFQPVHLQLFYRKMFGYKPGDFPICESISQRTIALPFYNNLREKDIDFVVKNFKKVIDKLK